MSHYLPLGTVSHGTLLNKDLIPVFLGHLREFDEDRYLALDAEVPSYKGSFDDDRALQLFAEEYDIFMYSSDAYDLLDTLMDELEKYCPPGTYFGTHPGDGSDYGVWPNDSE